MTFEDYLSKRYPAFSPRSVRTRAQIIARLSKIGMTHDEMMQIDSTTALRIYFEEHPKLRSYTTKSLNSMSSTIRQYQDYLRLAGAQ